MSIHSRFVVGLGTLSVVGLSFVSWVGCTVNTSTTQPEAGPDPAATGVQAVSTATPADSMKMPDVTAQPVGDWVKPNPSGKADGDPCSKPDDCKSGICDGEGCDTGAKCAAANRMCTRDLVTYCGCDGKTFNGSGTCPGRPYKKKGSCN